MGALKRDRTNDSVGLHCTDRRRRGISVLTLTYRTSSSYRIDSGVPLFFEKLERSFDGQLCSEYVY